MSLEPIPVASGRAGGIEQIRLDTAYGPRLMMSGAVWRRMGSPATVTLLHDREADEFGIMAVGDHRCHHGAVWCRSFARQLDLAPTLDSLLAGVGARVANDLEAGTGIAPLWVP